MKTAEQDRVREVGLGLLTLVLSMALAGLPRDAANAQAPVSIALDASFGGSTGRGGDYRDSGMPGTRLALSVREPGKGFRSLYGEVAMEWQGVWIGHDTSCEVGTRTPCRQNYPDFSGPSAIVGVLTRPRSNLEVRVGIGGAAYEAYGTRVGALTGQLDAAIFADFLGLSLGARPILVPRYRHDQLSIIAWSLGLRVRFGS